MSQTASLEILLENAKDINNFPQKEIRQYLSKNKQNKGVYSKRWLTDFLAKLLKFNSRQEYISKYQKPLQQMLQILKNHNTQEQMVLEILNNSVSMRSSYGFRKKGLSQIVRNNQITKNCKIVEEMTEDDMDHYLETNCS